MAGVKKMMTAVRIVYALGICIRNSFVRYNVVLV